MELREKINALEKSANEAYLNSISLNLVYSSNPSVKTRTSEAKRYASLTKELRNAKFALSCQEIEATLPDFKYMTLEEICIWASGTKNLIHYCPCTKGDYETAILHEDGIYYLAIIGYSEDGWVSEAQGARITHRVADILVSKGLNIVEN